eukprot:s981_g17.t1
MEHAHLCEAGTWSRGWALFFVKRTTEGDAPTRQVLLCRVHGVFGGRQADIRCCDCAACAGGTAVRKTDVFDGEVMKSPLDLAGGDDTRNYRALTLGNGMRVLLASDPDAITASSALSVHVGFYSDPEELALRVVAVGDIPGLAHFCEHMLFLGTKEYPEENSFESFLVANSGSQNAFTSESSTTYFFEVSPSGLRESLQRFASFFREPLFTASATEREVNAISSEFAKNQENEPRPHIVRMGLDHDPCVLPRCYGFWAECPKTDCHQHPDDAPDHISLRARQRPEQT